MSILFINLKLALKADRVLQSPCVFLKILFVLTAALLTEFFNWYLIFYCLPATAFIQLLVIPAWSVHKHDWYSSFQVLIGSVGQRNVLCWDPHPVIKLLFDLRRFAFLENFIQLLLRDLDENFFHILFGLSVLRFWTIGLRGRELKLEPVLLLPFRKVTFLLCHFAIHAYNNHVSFAWKRWYLHSSTWNKCLLHAAFSGASDFVDFLLSLDWLYGSCSLSSEIALSLKSSSI